MTYSLGVLFGFIVGMIAGIMAAWCVIAMDEEDS